MANSLAGSQLSSSRASVRTIPYPRKALRQPKPGSKKAQEVAKATAVADKGVAPKVHRLTQDVLEKHETRRARATTALAPAKKCARHSCGATPPAPSVDAAWGKTVIELGIATPTGNACDSCHRVFCCSFTVNGNWDKVAQLCNTDPAVDKEFPDAVTLMLRMNRGECSSSILGETVSRLRSQGWEGGARYRGLRPFEIKMVYQKPYTALCDNKGRPLTCTDLPDPSENGVLYKGAFCLRMTLGSRTTVSVTASLFR